MLYTIIVRYKIKNAEIVNTKFMKVCKTKSQSNKEKFSKQFIIIYALIKR